MEEESGEPSFRPHPPIPAGQARGLMADGAMGPPLSRNAGEGAGGLRPRAGEGFAAETVGCALAEATGNLAEAGIGEPRRRARGLLAAALGFSAAEIFAYPERLLNPAQQSCVSAMLGRMLVHEPLSRIVGKREFWGLEFLLSADTLDPRPDSETLVEAILARLPERDRAYRFLDLGTGSGVLLLALLSEYKAASGVGIDIAPDAARTARDNAVRLGLQARAHFVAGDWAAPLKGRFDVVVANPPYIERAAIADLPPEVRRYDPIRALDGGADGLAAYRAIAAELRRLLPPGGLFATEIGQGQASAVIAILARHGLQADGVASDLAGIERVVIARA